MNRFAACDDILILKDQGVKEIYVIIDGKEYRVPTAHDDLVPSTTISGVTNAVQEDAFKTRVPAKVFAEMIDSERML